MRFLVDQLSRITGRPVVDGTGLSGDFALKLEFGAEPGMKFLLVPSPSGPALTPPPDAPSLFTALQEQLGLKLDPRREPTEVLVIDGAEQPTPD